MTDIYTYEFTIKCVGKGRDMDEAWEDVLDYERLTNLSASDLSPRVLEVEKEPESDATPIAPVSDERDEPVTVENWGQSTGEVRAVAPVSEPEGEIECDACRMGDAVPGPFHFENCDKFQAYADLAEKNDQEDSYYSAEGHNREIDFPADLER